ncbi:hypothetical protein GuangZ0019_0833 [Mycobacterium tuberculosis GuangZ0019]|nr:hypothetical protein BTB1458_1902 [Mycobacterium tuberculosis]EQM22968.1 hypothetical protein GuangZ0019_0833 [Mycobacterium tuberculosis GuangZ0019]EQM23242.1 hypothetical protein FJ05194_0970 [Mycobacterium tuberculosis FJ05194]BAQ05730.1 hypothetical protein KURONO_1933 [Mycobacterium tuberculosis str. Kurono]
MRYQTAPQPGATGDTTGGRSKAYRSRPANPATPYALSTNYRPP